MLLKNAPVMLAAAALIVPVALMLPVIDPLSRKPASFVSSLVLPVKLVELGYDTAAPNATESPKYARPLVYAEPWSAVGISEPLYANWNVPVPIPCITVLYTDPELVENSNRSRSVVVPAVLCSKTKGDHSPCVIASVPMACVWDPL